MIGAELYLVALLGGGGRQSHDPSVVDEKVKLIRVGIEGIGSIFDRLERS